MNTVARGTPDVAVGRGGPGRDPVRPLPAGRLGHGPGPFPARANGSLVVRNGKIRGSSLIAPGIHGSPKYFHPRPSAAGNGYDAGRSGGSNLGPLSRNLSEIVRPARRGLSRRERPALPEPSSRPMP